MEILHSLAWEKPFQKVFQFALVRHTEDISILGLTFVLIS